MEVTLSDPTILVNLQTVFADWHGM